MNDFETVALIGGGHAFGKCHGACSLGAGDGPDVDAENPWPGNCGNGIAENTFTSGFEGAWTHTPLQWSNEYFTQLLYHNYTLWTGPGGGPQWQNDQNGLMMLTTDLALVADDDYKAIVEEFAADIEALNTAFAASWQKLVESGNDSYWAANRFCIDGNTLATEYVSAVDEFSNDDDADSDNTVLIVLCIVATVCVLVMVLAVIVLSLKLREAESSGNQKQTELVEVQNTGSTATDQSDGNGQTNPQIA